MNRPMVRPGSWLSDRLLLAARKRGLTLTEIQLLNQTVYGWAPPLGELQARLDLLGAPRWPR